MCNSPNNLALQGNSEPPPLAPAFVQHHGHSRKLTLNIGGSAKLFLGTSLKASSLVVNLFACSLLIRLQHQVEISTFDFGLKKQ